MIANNGLALKGPRTIAPGDNPGYRSPGGMELWRSDRKAEAGMSSDRCRSLEALLGRRDRMGNSIAHVD